MQPPPRHALLVLGMHRSGTSALARVLMLHGLASPTTEITVAADNPRGFWEPRDVQMFNDRLLAHLARTWRDTRPVPLDTMPEAERAVWRAEAAAVLAAEFPGDAPFVLKEPRLARLLPFWLPVLAEAGVQPRVALALRNPLEVAASLAARNGMAQAQALLLWAGHMLAAERQTRHLTRRIMAFDALLGDWRAALSGPFMATLLPAGATPDATAIDDFLSGSLRHHAVSTDDLLRRADVPQLVRRAYAALRVAPDAEPDTAALDLCAAEFASFMAGQASLS
jgi:hypothetical protein